MFKCLLDIFDNKGVPIYHIFHQLLHYIIRTEKNAFLALKITFLGPKFTKNFRGGTICPFWLSEGGGTRVGLRG